MILTWDLEVKEIGNNKVSLTLHSYSIMEVRYCASINKTKTQVIALSKHLSGQRTPGIQHTLGG